jgi:hypothetical protein
MRLGRGQSEADQLGDGVRKASKEVGDGEAQVINEEIVSFIGGVLRCGGAEINEDFVTCIGRHVMGDRRADDS